MTILSSDIKLRVSERMTDTTDGGGRRTNNLIVDGVAGNIFPKVSRVDAVYGRVNMRKIYPHVDTAGVDVYAGAHFIVTDAPDNDRIHVTAFSTASDYDTRTAARDRIESYVIVGPESRMVLYGRQLINAQALLAYQRVEEPLPEIGEVYALSNETGGVTGNQQFVSIQEISDEVRTFVTIDGSFDRRVLTLTIGAPLRYEFVGYDTPSKFSGSPAGAKMRSTTVADASRYFGIQPLAVAAVTDDLSVSVASVYTPIVPTTQRETALNLSSIAGALWWQPAATSLTPYRGPATNVGFNWTTNTATLTCARRPMPGSVHVQLTAVPYGVCSNAIDNGAGVITAGVPVPGISGINILGGTIDYDTGRIVVNLTPGGSGYNWKLDASYTPAVEVSGTAHTHEIEITLGTRGTVYTPVLAPLPTQGTLIVDFRALGKWYRLRDDGTGVLAGGDAAYGTGTVNYVTGGAIITLGALPDVGSSILLSWGSKTHYEPKTNDAGTSARFHMTLPDTPVKRGSVVVTYYVNGSALTATAGLQGAITGTNSVTGKIEHITGELYLDFGAKPPDSGSVVSVAYTKKIPTNPAESIVYTESFPALTPTTLANAPFDSGSIRVSVTFRTPALDYWMAQTDAIVAVVDDGAGNLIVPRGTVMVPAGASYSHTEFLVSADTTVGTINYTTGAITLSSTSDLVPISGGVWQWYMNGWVTTPLHSTILAGSSAQFIATLPGIAASDSAKTATSTIGTNPLVIDLLHTVGRPIVAESLQFDFTGKTYIDRSGSIYTDVDPVTGVGTLAGTADYSTGLVSLWSWANNLTNALTITSCLTKFGNWVTVESNFRTAGSPLRPASLYVQVTADDGTLITGVADQNGVITGAHMRGVVEQTVGVVKVEYGEMVTAAGNEPEPWYDAANVVGANVWKPKPVQPETLRYSSVVLSNLPLNADILGLDPVRLPSDGRVPIYRPADVVVVHNTLSYNAGTPAAGAVFNMGRTDLAALWLEDANKLKLSTALYAANLVAGTVTMAADLSLTGYVTPITVKHRIEEMGLLSDVQINGEITLTAPLLRDYPLGSYVSSALLFGDLFARVTGVFDQATWTQVWSNALIGTGATAQYNDVDYPIAVLNSAAVSDRWRISFTTTTAFQVVSENMGVIGTGTTGADMAPVNPLTGLAYFTLRAAGWGAGWAVGNQLRFNTVGATPPVWLARTVLPGATLAGDSFDAQLRGDVD